MVKYAISTWGGDSSRVYSTGISSGAMMTTVLAGAYPDIFKAGAVYSGAPDGCFYVSSATAGMSEAAWNVTCSREIIYKQPRSGELSCVATILDILEAMPEWHCELLAFISIQSPTSSI